MKIKVKFIKTAVGIGLGYFEGNIAELDEKLAAELIEMGYIEKHIAKNTIQLPDDFPARETLIKAGFTDLEDLFEEVENGTLTKVKGIGSKTAVEIENYLNKIR